MTGPFVLFLSLSVCLSLCLSRSSVSENILAVLERGSSVCFGIPLCDLQEQSLVVLVSAKVKNRDSK